MENIIEINHLQTSVLKNKKWNHLTSDISFTVGQGETLAIVGESGCGKSITALSIMGVLGRNVQVTEGSILFEEKNLLSCSEKEMEGIRGKDMAMIFQDTMSALNPVFTIGNQIVEAIKLHEKVDSKTAWVKALDMLRRVGLPRPEKIMKEHAFMLSGGMRQRAMIAMALCCSPKLLIADEPTTALDVTIQAQIIRLMKDLRTDFNMGILLITHDMGVVAELADRVIVMYAGEIVEETDVFNLFENPRHPYTKALLKSIPRATDEGDRVLASIPGVIPNTYERLTGCRFSSRCDQVYEKCSRHPDLKDLRQGHQVRCHAVWEEDAFNG